jgi:hypothetical protein
MERTEIGPTELERRRGLRKMLSSRPSIAKFTPAATYSRPAKRSRFRL